MGKKRFRMFGSGYARCIEVLAEVYSILKQYIPSKDRQEAADTLMSTLVDVLGDQELKEFGTVDVYTKRSYDEYSGNIDDSDDDEYDE
jgi:uncharacterized protein YqeY